MSTPTLNGHQPTTPTGLWLPPGLQQMRQQASPQHRPAPATQAPATQAPATQSTQVHRAAETTPGPSAAEASRQEPAATHPTVGPLDPVAIRRHHEKAAETEVQRIRAAASDRVSNLLGWLVAILAGLLSLEGFRLFGQMLGWPPIASMPGTDVVIGPLVTLWFTIDVIAFVAMKQWLNPAFSPATRRLGMQVSVAALGISVLINAIGHGFHGGPYAWVAVPAAALPPALLWAVLFLRDRRLRDVHNQIAAVRERHEKATERALGAAQPATTGSRSLSKSRTKTSKTTAGTPSTTRSSTTNNPDKTGNSGNPGNSSNSGKSGKSGKDGRSDDELVAALLHLDAQHGRRVGQHIGLHELGVGRSRFDRIRAEADRHIGPAGNTNHNPADGGDPR